MAKKKGKRGEQVMSLGELVDLANAKRSVVTNWAGFGKPKPAAFVVCMQGRDTHRMLRCGMYVWEKPERTSGGPTWFKGELVPVKGEDEESSHPCRRCGRRVYHPDMRPLCDTCEEAELLEHARREPML